MDTNPHDGWFHPLDDIHHGMVCMERLHYYSLVGIIQSIQEYKDLFSPDDKKSFDEFSDFVAKHEAMIKESWTKLRIISEIPNAEFVRSVHSFLRIKPNLSDNFIADNFARLFGQRLIPTGPTIRFEHNGAQYVIKTNYCAMLSGDILVIMLTPHTGVRRFCMYDSIIRIYLDSGVYTGAIRVVSDYLSDYVDWLNYIPVTREFILRWIMGDDEMYCGGDKISNDASESLPPSIPVTKQSCDTLTNKVVSKRYREFSHSIFTNSVFMRVSTDKSHVRMVLGAGLPYIASSKTVNTMTGLHINLKPYGDTFVLAPMDVIEAQEHLHVCRTGASLYTSDKKK